ncbi:MAG: CoA-binding protein [Pseudomonadota bacterium]
MADDTTDSEIRRIFAEAKVVALIGASPDPARVSNRIGNFLVRQGYRVIPVNPVAAGQEIFGETVVGSLAEAPEADFLDVFRRSKFVPDIVDEALEVMPALKTVWMQLGVRSESAATKASQHGITAVQDRCPAIEIPRLGITR